MIEHHKDFDDFSSTRFSRHLREYRKNKRGKRNLFYKGIRYASKAEISCAKALEKYCGWRAVEGQTYQVPIGHGKYCDFRVGEVLVEFHPVIFSRELHRPAYHLLQDALKLAKESVRRDVREALKVHLFLEYADKRDWSVRLNHDKEIRDAELIVVPGVREFYKEVIKRFAVKKVPNQKDFVRMFKNGSFK